MIKFSNNLQNMNATHFSANFGSVKSVNIFEHFVLTIIDKLEQPRNLDGTFDGQPSRKQHNMIQNLEIIITNIL